MRRTMAILLVATVLLAGCAGSDAPERTTTATTETAQFTATTAETTQPPTATVTTTTPGERTVRIVGGSAPMDPNRQFARVEKITGYDAEPPGRIVFKDSDELTSFDPTPSEVERYLGFSPANFYVHAYASLGEVVVNDSMGPTETEIVLSHELHHVLLSQRNVNFYDDSGPRSSQQIFLARAMTEGAADYVQQRYWRQYLEQNGTDPAASLSRTYRNGTPMKRQARAPYHFGYRYISYRVDSPRNLSAVYERPPRTTEELIHLRPPGSEPMAPLSVTRNETENWTPDWGAPPDTRGELFLRHTLQTGVDDSAAARGAAGWGNDEMLAFDQKSGTANGYVWVLRFDDAASASEFENVFETYGSNRGERDGSVWVVETSNGTTATLRPIQVDAETVAVALGPREFVTDATVTVSNGTVVAEPP